METLEAIIARHAIPVVEVVYFSTCYGCGVPIKEGEAYRPEFCSAKCYCETSCIDREDG
jgi:predicted nucleic acid-binding Zn ribbon protein